MSISATESRYRPDIDGLRALAVTVVVLFHAEVPGFSGGFVGVDVFFVISGFLITGILARGFAKGNFSLVEFYERRARRILPALFVMVLGVLALAPFFIYAWDLEALGRSVKYVVTSVANFDFYKVLTDYNGDDASLTPMLHTWSLSVEEQFYIVVPAFWWLLCKFTGRPSRWVMVFSVIALISFAASARMVIQDQSACFFLLPYRAWELAAGGLLALAPLPAMSRLGSQICGIAGVGMILGATFWFDHETSFPGAWALVPCLGAILIICAGLAAAPVLPTRVLSSRPFVFVGLISYSVYLWHWPLLVFAKYQQQYSGGGIQWWQTTSLIALAYLFGWLSWRFVEKPFRKNGFWTRRRIFIFAWSGIIVLFFLGHYYQKTSLFLNLLPDEARRMTEARLSSNPLLKGGRSRSEIDTPGRYGRADVDPDTVLWGDSHSGTLTYPLHEVALSKNRAFLYHSRPGTAPVKGIVCGDGINSWRNARYTNEVYEALIRDKHIRNVILAARWAVYTEGYTWAFGPAEFSKKSSSPNVILPGRPANGSVELRSGFGDALEETVSGLVEAGKTVYLVYPIPELGFSLPELLANEVIEGRDPREFRISAEKIYYERTSAIIAILDRVAQKKGVVPIRPEKLLIEDNQIRLLHEGAPMYRDDDHLSVEGGRYLMPLFEQIF